MQTTPRQSGFRTAYSLAEMLAVLVILSLVLVAVLGIYTRANRAAANVLEKIDAPVLTTEVFQLIARDLDKIMSAENVSLQVRNGYDNGFVTSEITLRWTVDDPQRQEQLLEEIVWRAACDYESAVPGMVLYRSHKGVAMEDKLLDSKRDDLESESPLIPICRGVTFFRIEIPKGEGSLSRWVDPELPGGVRVMLSFAEPYETVRGTKDVPEQQRSVRTMAINRARKIPFMLPKGPEMENADKNGQPEETQDANDVSTQRTRRRR